MPARRRPVTTTHRKSVTGPPSADRPKPGPRRVAQGDVGPTSSPAVIESHVVGENADATQEAQVAALRDILAGRSPTEATALVARLLEQQRARVEERALAADEELADDIGAIPRDVAWPYTCIDWERAARELQYDYTGADFDGVTYYYRA